MRVAQMQRAGDVGRRHRDGEGAFGGVRLGNEIAALFPEAIEPLFYRLGVVGFGQIGELPFGFNCHVLPLLMIKTNKKGQMQTKSPFPAKDEERARGTTLFRSRVCLAASGAR